MEEEEWFKKTYGADVKIKTNDEGLRERLKAMKDNNLNFLDETSMIQNDMYGIKCTATYSKMTQMSKMKITL